jgi:hypothetical protein
MFIKTVSTLLAATACMALGEPARAATIYDEAVSGDIDSGTPLNLGLLGKGANSILGSSGFEYGFGPANDLDSFSFSVGRGSALAGARLSVSLRPIGSGDLSILGWQLQGDGGLFADDSSDVPGVNHPLFAGLLPLGEGEYQLSNYISGALGPGQFRVADYKLDLEVAPVPLPASFWLMAVVSAALAAAGVPRRQSCG